MNYLLREYSKADAELCTHLIKWYSARERAEKRSSNCENAVFTMLYSLLT